MTDFLESLQHSWGKSPKQKAREKEYNAEYYRKHKEKWLNTKRPLTDTIRGYQDALLDSGRSYSSRKVYPISDNYMVDGSIAEQMSRHQKEMAEKHRGAGRNITTYGAYPIGSDYTGIMVAVKPSKYRKQARAVEKAAKEFKSNWKIGAAMISDSAKKGADFVKNLFK